MSTWALELEARSKEREELNRLRIAKALQDRQILDRKAPQIFLKITNELGTRLHEFNSLCEPSRRLSLTCGFLTFTLSRSMRKAVITGSLSNDKLTVIGKNGLRLESEWNVKVISDGLDIWLFDNDDIPAEIDTMVKNLIERLIEKTDSE